MGKHFGLNDIRQVTYSYRLLYLLAYAESATNY